MIIKATLNNIRANKIRIGDLLTIKTSDRSSKKEKEFLVKVIKVVSDIPRCNGCTIILSAEKTYRYSRGTYCADCLKRKIEKRKTDKIKALD